MRILNVTTSLDPLEGGQSERTLQMSRALAAAGDTVEILVTDKGLTAERIDSAKPAKVRQLMTLNKRFFVPALSPGKLRGIVASCDVVHLMGYWSLLNAAVFQAARRTKTPFVLCPAGSWRLFGRSMMLKQAFDRLVGRRLVADASRLIAITSEEAEWFRQRGVEASRIAVIPNAVDPADYASLDDLEGFRLRHGLPPRPFILFMGRLSPIKGPDLLLDAYLKSSPAVRDYDLVFGGSDEGMQASLEALASSMGASQRVHFIGHLSGEEKSRALHAAAFMVIPSRHEAMSIVVLEAGAAGTPVLATDRCGLGEIATAKGGLVVPCDADQIRTGLERMASSDLAVMGERLRELVLMKYTWKSIAGVYSAVYREILNKETPAQRGHDPSPAR